MSTKSSSRMTKSENGYKTPTYRPIGNNIYATTNSNGKNKYRVRMSINNVRYDEYFTNKSVALQYRKELYKMKG